MPHLLRYLTIGLYDAIVPLDTPLTRVENWLQGFQFRLWLLPTLGLVSIPLIVLPVLIEPPTQLISGVYRWKDEVEVDAATLPPQN